MWGYFKSGALNNEFDVYTDFCFQFLRQINIDSVGNGSDCVGVFSIVCVSTGPGLIFSWSRILPAEIS